MLSRDGRVVELGLTVRGGGISPFVGSDQLMRCARDESMVDDD